MNIWQLSIYKEEYMKHSNHMKIEFDSRPENEGFIRTVMAGFVMGLDPTLEELNDVKTAVSEAVTNCIIHGYEGKGGKIIVEATIIEKELCLCIEDFGIGIDNISQAMEALYTSKPEMERSGMGFSFMEAFMDDVQVYSVVGKGTKILMKKGFKQNGK